MTSTVTSYFTRPLALLLWATLAAGVMMVLASPAHAATYTVNSTADTTDSDGCTTASGGCTLREATNAANTSSGVADTINFDEQSLPGQQTITLVSQLTITDSAGLIIDGGSAKITVSGNNAVRVFEVSSGAKLTLNNLTVANGRAAGGAGILNDTGTLTVTNSTLSGNNTNDDVPYGGGGIVSYGGTVTVSNSTLSGNSASGGGGGINNAGGTLTVTNSTLSGNSANSADGYFGGGIESHGGSATLQNTIVANSPSGGGCYGPITDGGYNLDSDGSCRFGTANNSLSGVDPMLGPLANNGGPTQTHALLEGSPAIDRIPDTNGSTSGCGEAGITTDQRGVQRPQGEACDIGAYEGEVDLTAPSVSATIPQAGQEGVSPATNVKATFSEAMKKRTINSTTFTLKLKGATTNVAATVLYSASTRTATLKPEAKLAAASTYVATVSTQAKDEAGNRLDQDPSTAGTQKASWKFTTGP